MHRRAFLADSSRLALSVGLLPLAGCATSKSSHAESKGHDDEVLIAGLEKLIPQVMAEAHIPGVSIALIKDGKIFWRRGFGVKDNASKEPVDNETVFEAASVSKTVFAYAALKLCERGVIGLDTPLTKYSPKPFLEGDPRLELITARHVLSHAAGFQDWRSREQPLRIHFTPGEKFAYSGEGYYYLQSVITHLTGHVDPSHCGKYEAGLEVCATDISEYMKRNVLAPFGMNSSGYVWDDFFERHAARPHDTDGKPFTKSKPTATAAARYASAGGLLTTPTDYARFLIEVIDPKAPDAFRLGESNVKEMLRPQVKLDENTKIDGATSWALGWAIQERDTGNVIVHSGGQAGFKSLTMASPERRAGFVILTNGDNGWKVFNNEAFAGLMNRLLAV